MKKAYRYEIMKNWRKENNPVNWEKGCKSCGKPLGEEDKFVRVDVQTGNFRGDDDVFCFHKVCWKGMDSIDEAYEKLSPNQT